MTQILLDGEKMTSKKTAHLYMKEKLKAIEYYGENLDALWDVLSTYDRDISVGFINEDKLLENLGDYGKSIMGIFKDLAQENKNIKLIEEVNHLHVLLNDSPDMAAEAEE